MVPEISRREWEDIVSGKINPKLTSLSLQMKLNNLQLSIRLKKTDVKYAAIELHSFCSEREKMYEKDLNMIFNVEKV